MSVKSVGLLTLKLVALTVLMFVFFAVASAIARLGGGAGARPEAAARAALALLGLCLVSTLVLAYPILRSRWHGFKLIATVFLVFFGTQTFQAQIETLYFAGSLGFRVGEVMAIVLAGTLVALFYAPAAVAILGKLRPSDRPESGARPLGPRRRFVERALLLAAIYAGLYFAFGYFVAWRSPAVRELYTGSTELRPFLAHMADLVRGDPAIVPWQLLRGVLWVGLAIPVIKMMKGRRWETSLALGLLFGLLLTAPLLLPNPYMSAPVRLAHFLETSTSTFIYGWLVGWLLPAGRA